VVGQNSAVQFNGCDKDKGDKGEKEAAASNYGSCGHGDKDKDKGDEEKALNYGSCGHGDKDKGEEEEKSVITSKNATEYSCGKCDCGEDDDDD